MGNYEDEYKNSNLATDNMVLFLIQKKQKQIRKSNPV